MTTGEKIKAARKKAKMTQAQLAEKMKIPYQSIGQWERDIRNPKPDTLKSIAKYLNCNYLDLYGDEDSKEIAEYIKQGMKLGAQANDGLTRAEILSEYMEHGYSFVQDESRLVSAYNSLNIDGQSLALATVEGMATSERFKKKADPDEK